MKAAGSDGRWAKLKSVWERVGESLFYLPALFMAGAVAISQILVALDQTLEAGDLPAMFDSTVESSRVLLSVIAGGTITAASVVFSLTLVAVQLASTQFSPRTLGTFLGDRAQQFIIGLVLGTFVYCILVLRVVGAPVDEGGDPFIPRFSVMVAAVLGVAAMIAVIASINRTAQSLRVESVAKKITATTIAAIKDRFGDVEELERAVQSVSAVERPTRKPPPGAITVGAVRAGWVQDINIKQLATCVEEGSRLLLHQSVGTYVLREQPLVSVWPSPPEAKEDNRELVEAFVVADQRSRHGDIGFGITQLVDIAARALSPGINDPKTAEEMVLHIGEILVELAVRDLPAKDSEVSGRTIIRGADLQHADYVELAIEPIRRFARNDPQVLATILKTLATATEVATRRRPDAAVAAFDEQARLIVQDTEAMATRSDRDLATREVAVPGSDRS